MPDDVRLRICEARLSALEDKLTRSQHALSVSIGLAAGLAHVMSMQYPGARAQLETALLDSLDEAAGDPVTLAVLREILTRLDGTGKPG